MDHGKGGQVTMATSAKERNVQNCVECSHKGSRAVIKAVACVDPRPLFILPSSSPPPSQHIPQIILRRTLCPEHTTRDPHAIMAKSKSGTAPTLAAEAPQ